jgi:predicted P-loop ATPase
LRHDQFADRNLIEGLGGFGHVLDDAAVDRLWLTFERRFKLNPNVELMFKVVTDTARLNSFHPVRNYLDGLSWDGVQRIDRWLTIYGGADDSNFVREIGALLLVAAVRRVRQPGCKFDEMVVLESPDQGTNKSSALAALAGRDEWFTDDLPLGCDGRQMIEALRGRWIVEASELSGMRRADVERLKAFLSRQTDHGRMAYAKLPTDAPRQCVIVGTTNAEEYLRDPTGNRRIWPVRVKRFDVAALDRDRDQLWAEAAARERDGVSIRLGPALWKRAGEEQSQRLTVDPFYETLKQYIGGDEFNDAKISSMTVWTILGVSPGQQTQDMNRRLGEAIRRVGWRRANSSGLIKIKGKLVMGYVRGNEPRREVIARRWRWEGEETLSVLHTEDGTPKGGRSNHEESPI